MGRANAVAGSRQSKRESAKIALKANDLILFCRPPILINPPGMTGMHCARQYSGLKKPATQHSGGRSRQHGTRADALGYTMAMQRAPLPLAPFEKGKGPARPLPHEMVLLVDFDSK